MKIIIYSKNIFLQELLTKFFKENLIETFSEMNQSNNQSIIAIIDGSTMHGKGLPVAKNIILLSHENNFEEELYFIKTPCSIFNIAILIRKILSNIVMVNERITIDLEKKLIIDEAYEVYLTDKEASIINVLNQSHKIHKTELLKKIWGYEPSINTHTLETHIYNLRQKIPENIISTDDEGYYRLIKG